MLPKSASQNYGNFDGVGVLPVRTIKDVGKLVYWTTGSIFKEYSCVESISPPHGRDVRDAAKDELLLEGLTRM